MALTVMRIWNNLNPPPPPLPSFSFHFYAFIALILSKTTEEVCFFFVLHFSSTHMHYKYAFTSENLLARPFYYYYCLANKMLLQAQGLQLHRKKRNISTHGWSYILMTGR